MGKGLQIALMALLYVASAAGGYFVYGAIESSGVLHASEVQVSHVPEILSAPTPERQTDGKYRLMVDAYVESNEMLEYLVYSDTLMQPVYHSADGIFEDIPGITSATYYVSVKNTVTLDQSGFLEVKGFTKPEAAPQKFRKITAAEIEMIVRDWEKAPSQFNQSFAPDFILNLVGVESNGRVKTVFDMAQQIELRRWTSVTVTGISYDGQHRIKSLTVQVTPKQK